MITALLLPAQSVGRYVGVSSVSIICILQLGEPLSGDQGG